MDLERPEWLEQMEGILETLNEGVLIGDDCNHIVSVNSVFLEMAGIAREEMLGRSSDHFYSGEDAAFLRRQIALGGYGPAATIVGLFFILGLVAAPFLPETNGKPLPETMPQPLPLGAE